MARPNVTITKLNGGIGGIVPSKDGVSLLVISFDTTAYTGLTGSSWTGIQLSDFQAQGFTEAKDLAQNVLVWEHIKDFYLKAPAGTELHVLALPNTVTFTALFTAATASNTILKAYLLAKKGLIKLVGVALNLSTDVLPTAGISADLIAALPLAQALANTEFANFRPIELILEGRQFTAATLAAATDLRTRVASSVSVMVSRDGDRRSKLILAGHTGTANYAAVGFALGRLAGISVQTNIGRRKDGAVGWLDAELSAGQKIVTFTDADLDALSDKGYLFVTQDTGQEGFFFNDDPTCAALSDDYCYITRNRVINKAARIARRVYLTELLDEISVDADTGKISSLDVKRFEDVIKSAIEDEMIELGEADAVTVFIDPAQNILATGILQILVQVQPKGYARFIKVSLKLSNPANS